MEFTLKENGMRTQLTYGDLEISGNEEFGYRPFQLMVASIAGCSGSVYLKILAKQRVQIEDLHISAEVDRDPSEANRINKIALRYVVKGHHLDPDKLYKNLEVARRNCSMIRSVEDSIEITEKVEIIELSM